MLNGEFERNTIDSKGVLRFDGFICVLIIDELIQLTLHEAHRSRYSIHLGSTKM